MYMYFGVVQIYAVYVLNDCSYDSIYAQRKMKGKKELILTAVIYNRLIDLMLA